MKNDTPVEFSIIKKMTKVIEHRGPDEDGFYINGSIGLGFRRLSIIDIENGSQPLTNEDKTIFLIFNGEIYNFEELRNNLIKENHIFTTNSDGEVIVHLYEKYGFDFLNYLRGMFSFILYDQKNNILFFARDHFGIKPLYYAETDDAYIFSSEIKSIIEYPKIKTEICLESLWNYYTFQYVPDPLTMFKRIYKLAPGSYGIVKNGRIHMCSYWEPVFDPDNKPIDHYVEEIKSALLDSISNHLKSDVPVGAFLSSGIDSAGIVALIKETGRVVDTFTVGFYGNGEKNEIAYAKYIANILGMPHHNVIVTPKDYLNEIPKAVYYQDEPVADPSALGLYFVARLAKEYVKVVLSGEGADELFGGYGIYKEPLSLKIFNFIPSFLRYYLYLSANKLPDGIKGKSFIIRGTKPLRERYFGNAYIFNEDLKKELLFFDPIEVGARLPTEITKVYYDRAEKYDDITKMQFIDIKTWLPGDILAKADKMTMAHSLELRVPYLDKKVFSVASRIPYYYRITHRTTKYVLRKALSDILPSDVVFRKKLGFPVPIRKWLREDFFEWAYDIISSSKTDYIINKNFSLNLLMEHKYGVKDNSRKIWTILIFMIWHSIFIEKNILK